MRCTRTQCASVRASSGTMWRKLSKWQREATGCRKGRQITYNACRRFSQYLCPSLLVHLANSSRHNIYRQLAASLRHSTTLPSCTFDSSTKATRLVDVCLTVKRLSPAYTSCASCRPTSILVFYVHLRLVDCNLANKRVAILFDTITYTLELDYLKLMLRQVLFLFLLAPCCGSKPIHAVRLACSLSRIC